MITVISYGRAEKESWWSTPYCEIFSTGKSIDKNDPRQCLGSLPSKPAETVLQAESRTESYLSIGTCSMRFSTLWTTV